VRPIGSDQYPLPAARPAYSVLGHGRWAAAGHRHILVAPVGFVCDHVEILYDIDVVFRKYGEAAGVTISRPESLNDSPLFIEALAGLVSSRMVRGAIAPARV